MGENDPVQSTRAALLPRRTLPCNARMFAGRVCLVGYCVLNMETLSFIAALHAAAAQPVRPATPFQLEPGQGRRNRSFTSFSNKAKRVLSRTRNIFSSSSPSSPVLIQAAEYHSCESPSVGRSSLAFTSHETMHRTIAKTPPTCSPYCSCQMGGFDGTSNPSLCVHKNCNGLKGRALAENPNAANSSSKADESPESLDQGSGCYGTTVPNDKFFDQTWRFMLDDFISQPAFSLVSSRSSINPCFEPSRRSSLLDGDLPPQLGSHLPFDMSALMPEETSRHQQGHLAYYPATDQAHWPNRG